MTKFNELIRFCAEQYYSIAFCDKCKMDFCRRCNTNDCYLCLHYIHTFVNKTTHYSCEKITYNYILKYGYRYASEMAWAFYDIKNIFSQEQTIRIFSIGCGPSTELYGASIIFRNHHLNYYGFDLSDKWNSIQEFNKNSLENDKLQITFLRNEFIEYVNNNDLKCDILVLNYLLSDFIKFHPKECEKFINELIKQIMEGRFRLIIINDVMLLYAKGTGFSCMEEIANKLKDTKDLSFCFERRHFDYPNEWQFPYGTKHRDEIFTKQIADEAIPFDPFKTCGSIQLIIKSIKKQ